MQLGVSVEDPLQIFSEDGETPIESGDSLDFGTAEVDFWGTGPVPVRKVFIRNTSNTREHVVVTGDLGDGVLPLFGLSKDDLKPWPDNSFDLASSGDAGDTLMGWLGLKFLDLTSGDKSTTIIFRATPGPPSVPPPAGMVSWWPGDGNANDIVGGNHGTLAGGATFAKGKVGQAFSLDGVDDYVGDAGTLSSFSFIQNTGVFTIDAWIRLDDPNAIGAQVITETSNTRVHKGHAVREARYAGGAGIDVEERDQSSNEEPRGQEKADCGLSHDPSRNPRPRSLQTRFCHAWPGISRPTGWTVC